MKWLIAYDIACPRRLQRVYRCLCAYALPLQDSVFLLTGEQENLADCLQAVLPKLAHQSDDLRVYGLAAQGFWKSLGQTPLPEGIYYGEG